MNTIRCFPVFYLSTSEEGTTSLPIHSPTPSLSHSLPHFPIHTFTPSLPHFPSTPSLPHSLPHSLTFPFTPSLPHFPIPSLTFPFTPSLPHSLTSPLTHPHTLTLSNPFIAGEPMLTKLPLALRRMGGEAFGLGFIRSLDTRSICSSLCLVANIGERDVFSLGL